MADIRASEIGLETGREVKRATRDVWAGVLSRADYALSCVAEFRTGTARPVGAQYAIDALREAIVQMGSAGGAFAAVVIPRRNRSAAYDWWVVVTVGMVYMVMMVGFGEWQG